VSKNNRVVLTAGAAKNSLECDLDSFIVNAESIVFTGSFNSIVTERSCIERLEFKGRTSQQTDTSASFSLRDDELTIVTCSEKEQE